ncbi:MAG TPA: NADP-dependent oxidoreductase [Candidatus Eremiobacteraeota bacterium]|nr:MAG: putative NADP-dependent oxidoreductase YfmJ [bacterium ADurb.Bin363]HPZ07412.1 NADP-dependent oxidoreductase [Candidatus Eremiobacteraeota bacterium]
MINRQIILVKRPEGMPGEDCFKLIETSIPSPTKGELLIKTLYLSVDPYMRFRMGKGTSYISAFPLNEAITGGAVGEIIETKSIKFKKGEIVTGDLLPWQDYSVLNNKEVRKVDTKIAPPSTALGVMGMPGLTAYFGMINIGKAKAGETLVVSGAAGAVGMIAGQIGKIKGCHVVGIAGSHEKTEYLIKALGFDGAVNYKRKSFKQLLKAACPKGVDIYFDNVGGEISDAVLKLINYKARIVVCGQISLYNLSKIPPGPRREMELLSKRALMEGFIVMDYRDRFQKGLLELSEWVMKNKLKYAENIVEGLENAPKAFLGLFSGENLGKQIVKI